MKKIMYLLVATVALVVTTCSKDEAVDNNNENKITELNLAIEGSETRMTNEYVSGQGFKFEWEDYDLVYVFNAEEGINSSTLFLYDAATGTFKYNSGPRLDVGKKYYAVNGNQGFINDFNNGKVCAAMNLSSNDLNYLPMVSDIFTATADGTFATLHHIGGIVEIPVKGNKEIYTLELTVKNSADKLLQGTVVVEFDEDGKVGTITKTGTGASDHTMGATVTYDFDSKLALSGTEQSLFFPALPGTYDQVAICYFEGEYGRMTEGTLGTLTVQRGKINKKSTAVTIE